MSKPLLLLMIAFASLAAACKKSEGAVDDDGLVGKWQQYEYLISPGNMGTWQPYNGIPFYMHFYEDGRLTVTRRFLTKEYDHYSVIDDKTMWVINTATSDSTKLYYNLVAGKLIIWQQCIEPCGIKLQRVAKQ